MRTLDDSDWIRQQQPEEARQRESKRQQEQAQCLKRQHADRHHHVQLPVPARLAGLSCIGSTLGAW